MIAAASLALWASGTAAQTQPPGGEGPSGSPTPAPVAPAAPVAPPAPVATPAPAVPSAPPAAAQQGTPATVLDTQDYESLLGRSVRSAGGDELGRVIDVIIDKEGHPRAAIIDFGGFLGVGSRKIAVDWRALRFTADSGKERRLSVALTRNQVRVSPEYKSGEPIVVLGPASPSGPPPEGEAAAATQAAPQQAPPVQAPAQSPPQAAQATPAPAPAAPAPAQKPAPEKAPDK
ncbi:PRC-barrel domain-containing protein [Methylobacterium sp. NEAU 140]|uniref:PRC-barrel domain-containing protein n=1 Tax=Methylobacterium sp. NEAU 140 TaxID=3064945 RepID=UPI002734AFC4|nr:PRC-barrel domain-containing protein [Methylobacterium sp. NEAU 140]MDP4025697.1 PRC-barrel domain-containing protein [Methylobacterium sp. NEAU 140]